MLFVLNSLAVGGSELKIIKVANALARSGVAVELAYLNPPETSLDRIDPAIPVTNLHRRGKYSIAALRRLHRLVCREREAVVAVNIYPLLYVVPAAKWRRAGKARVVALVNTSEAIGRERLLRRFFAPVLNRCDAIVFGCEAQKSSWVEKYGLRRDRSQVIYNGVDENYYAPSSVVEGAWALRRELEIPDSAVVIGSVGRLAPEKNFEVLITSLARLKEAGREAYGFIVGQGRELESLKRLGRDQGVSERLRFLGQLSDVRCALGAMDVFVLPSRAVETFSNAALEAMAMSRPVVLSKMGGAGEMVEHGFSGMLFEVGDIESLTRILSELLDEPGRRLELGAAARRRVVDSFKFQDMVDEYRQLVPLA